MLDLLSGCGVNAVCSRRQRARVIHRGTVWSLDDEAGRRLGSGFSPDRCWVLSLVPRLELKVWSVSEGLQNTAVLYQHWPNTRLVEANSTAATSTS